METENLEELRARKRLEFELKKYIEDPPANLSYGPTSDEDMFHWQGIIFGPLDTPIEGHMFQLSLEFPVDYPWKPPKVTFETQVFHPNVDMDGRVYLNILENEWSSALSVEKLLLSISSTLFDPILIDGLFNSVE